MYKVGRMIFSVSGIQNEQMFLGMRDFEIVDGIQEVDYQVIYVDNFESILSKDIIYFNQNFFVTKSSDEYRLSYVGDNTIYAETERRENKYYIYLSKDAKDATFHRYFLPTLLGLERALIYKCSFILHSSYISLDNQGILFTAPSGGGKSTQADLWMRYKKAEILNGDKNIVGKEDKNWYIYGTPFSGSSQYCVNRTTPLNAIIILEKGPKNIVKRLDLKGFSKIFSQTTVNPWDPEFSAKIMDLIMKVCSEVPVYFYSCTKEESAVDDLYEVLVKDGVLHGVGNNIMEALVKKARLTRSPITVNFELLPVCNLNCKMCYIRSSWNDVKNLGGLKTADEWIEMAKQLKEAGTLFLLLTGGEVFIYPEFKRLYIELYKMGFVLTINTNGTLIDEEVVSWLRQYPPKCVSMSLYGASDETYESLCGQKGMFTRVNRAIELLKENHISIECKTMLTPLNIGDLEQCYQYTRERNILYEVATYSFPSIRKACQEEQLRFSAEKAADVMFYRNKIMSTEQEYADNIYKHLEKYEQTKELPGAIQRGFTCSACNSSGWINWQGKMTPCALMVEPYTFPFEEGFLQAWEELKQKVDQITLSSKCSYCDKRQVCTVCPASAYAETGSFDGTSEYHCKMTNRILETMNQFVEENGRGE